MICRPPKSWDEFEDIVADLYTRLWADSNTQRYGRSGQAQQGVDVYGRPPHLEGRYAGIQCKRYAEQVRQGLHEKKQKRGSHKGGGRKKGTPKKKDVRQMSLL